MVQVCYICEELVAGAAATVEVQGQEEAGGRGEMRAGKGREGGRKLVGSNRRMCR
jgi:hypothetical protein